jgi:hypothetical protein
LRPSGKGDWYTVMNERDEWGSNPSVRKMRKVFSHMEAEQSKLLKKLAMSPFDIRLRNAREEAKDVFERTWSLANSRGLNVDEEEIAGLYMRCLAWGLRKTGIQVPTDGLPCEENLNVLLQEVLQ